MGVSPCCRSGGVLYYFSPVQESGMIGGFGGYLGGKLQILGWRFSHHISQVYCREQTHNVDISLYKVVYLYVLRKDSMDVLNIYLMPTV